jgi:hypothetical protein
MKICACFFLSIGFVSAQTGSPASEPPAADTEARAVIGFQQAGAAAAASHQNFFFDFFIDRQLPSRRWSLWGDVRIASTPQQVSSPVVQFDLATQVAQLKVNELAQSAEFSTGLDFHPWSWTAPDSVRRFGFVLSAGATSPFDPVTQLSLFQVPATSSQQYAGFIAAFPQAAGSTYIGFVPPDRHQFYRNWGAGFRLTTVSHDTAATYTLTAGQDEAVTGGRLRGGVAKIDVFYPLPLRAGGFRYLYLFGNASLRLSRTESLPTFDLAPAPSTVNGFDPSVAIVAVPSNRDVYRIGVGVDAIGLVCAISATAGKPCN